MKLQDPSFMLAYLLPPSSTLMGPDCCMLKCELGKSTAVPCVQLVLCVDPDHATST
jgi:hypothetical protein